MTVEVGKRYRQGNAVYRVKEIREDILVRDIKGVYSTLVICDTPSSSKDLGLPLSEVEIMTEEK